LIYEVATTLSFDSLGTGMAFMLIAFATASLFSIVCIPFALLICVPVFRVFYCCLESMVLSDRRLAGFSAALTAPVGGFAGAVAEAYWQERSTIDWFGDEFIYCSLVGLLAGVPIAILLVRPK
ncbi:MAG: hypothetical protein AAFV19_21210, partial [Pseudomonadota bacterium]